MDEERLKELYNCLKADIDKRLLEFRNIWKAHDSGRIYLEMSFCILTPQSKARSCWSAVDELHDRGLLYEGSCEEIDPHLNNVRFKYTKAKRLVEQRERFLKDEEDLFDILASFEGPPDIREWLVKEVNGLGYKEASHFLRNIGLGEELAILDRHILKNLVLLGVIDELPKTITGKKYLEIEEKMKVFSRKVGIPMGALDLILWYNEAGEIFK